eukprot:gene4354-6161_t
MITEKHNKNHLQLRTIDPVWHKESMINVAVEYLLPYNWKAFAWIDADIEFENVNWAEDTLKLLNGYAWAISRNAYEKMGELIDTCILGSGERLCNGNVYHTSDP